MTHSRTWPRAPLLLLAPLLLGSLTGCFSLSYQTRSKRIAVTSDPPGALIEKTDAQGSQVLGRAPLTLEQPYQVKVKRFRRWTWIMPALLTACTAGGIYALSESSEFNPGAAALTFLCFPGAVATLVVSIIGEARSGKEIPAHAEKILVRGSLPGQGAAEQRFFVPPGVERLALQLSTPQAPVPRARQQQQTAVAQRPPDDLPPPDAAPPARSRRQLIVAVFDVQDAANRFPRKDLEQLTEYFSAKLTEVAGFRVVPRQQLRERLVDSKKEGYQRCFDESCQIELGKAVAAQKSLATKLLKIGNTCAISTTLYDLRSETAETAASARTGCNEEGLMDGMDTIVRQLARGSYR